LETAPFLAIARSLHGRGTGHIALTFWKNLPTMRISYAVSDHDEHPDPYTPPEALTSATPREKAMGFWEHLDELRGTIVKSIAVFIVFAAGIGYFLKEFNQTLLWPLKRIESQNLLSDLGTISPMEVFTVIITMCVFGGLMLASPFILFFIGQFVAPALTEREMKALLPLCISALILFLLGAAFGFFLLVPSTIEVSLKFNEMLGFTTRWTPGNYYSMLSWLVLGVGASFEFPLVIVLLVWMGIMTTTFLKKYRRHAIVVIFIIAAIVTPTPDPIVQTMFAAPLYALFEIAILVSSRVERRRAITTV
jgi:sec-independent protein translocase protein TatC